MSVLVSQLVFLGVTKRSLDKGLLTGSEMTYRWLCVSAQSHMVTLMKAATLEHSTQLAGSTNGLIVSLMLSWLLLPLGLFIHFIKLGVVGF